MIQKIIEGLHRTKKILHRIKKIPPVIGLLAAALFLELFVCNFSSWESLFYGEETRWEDIVPEGAVETSADGYYRAADGVLTFRLPAEGREIHNLHFDMLFSHPETVSYTVTLTDEGNCYPYSLPEQRIAPWVGKTFYTRLYPSGKAGDLSVSFSVPEGCALWTGGIYANVHMPVWFSPGRFAAIFAVLFLYYLIRTPGGMHRGVCFEKGGRERKLQLLIAAGVILLLTGTAWSLVHVNPICVDAPWPHHKQYQELARALAEGHFYLDAEPSEGLKNAANPYDTVYLQANGIDYRADYAFYGGKYYVYFGIVPELLLYLPCYLLTGKLFPNYLAVFFFYCGFIAAVFALYREMIKHWFAGTPFIVWLLVSALTVCCGNYVFVIARPDMYDTPIMAASMFTVAGLWLWIRGKYVSPGTGGCSGAEKRVCLLLGSLCMALVAGCRPQMVLFSFAAIPLFWNEAMKERKLFSLRSGWETACFCTPYVLVAVGIMYYNAARFGSPFDFGAAYSLTSNDMTKRGFLLHQTLLGLWHFFLQPPVIGSDFPFLQGNQIASASYMGKLNAEYTCGGILACNVFTWIALSVGKWKAELKKRGIYALTVSGILISVILCVVDVNGAGILQRYTVDMVWGLWFTSAILWLVLIHRARETMHYREAATLLLTVCLLQIMYAFGVVFGNGDLSVNVQTSNPYLYERMRALLRF